MPLTSTNLANRALAKLMVVGTGQSPDAEDTQQVLDTIPNVLEIISQDDVYTVSDANDIEERAFEWLAVIVAFYNASDFGRSPDAGALEYAEARLKKLTATRPTFQSMAAEYF